MEPKSKDNSFKSEEFSGWLIKTTRLPEQFLVAVLIPSKGFVNNEGTRLQGDILRERILKIQAIKQAPWILQYGL